MENDEFSSMVNDEIGLSDMIGFIGRHWKIIAGSGAVGVFASVGFLIVSQSQYEASALIEMAQFKSIIGGGNGNAQATSIEIPPLLLERLKIPTAYTAGAIKACGVEEEAPPAETMADMVKASLPKNLNSVVEIKIRRKSAELAKQCVGGVFEMISGQQAGLIKSYKDELRISLGEFRARLSENQSFVAKAEKAGLYQTVYLGKRDEFIYLTQQIGELERILSYEPKARLISPIYASPKPVLPKRGATLILGAAGGLVFGLLAAIGNKVLQRRRRK